MEQIYEIAGTVIIITMIMSSVSIGLFKFAFGTSSQLKDQPEGNRKWYVMGLSSQEYAQNCMPEAQRGKYIALLKVQRYSFYLTIFYLALGIVLLFI